MVLCMLCSDSDLGKIPASYAVHVPKPKKILSMVDYTKLAYTKIVTSKAERLLFFLRKKKQRDNTEFRCMLISNHCD